MDKRARGRAAWIILALCLASVLGYATFVGSLLNSCGEGDHGPNPGAEEDFCGYSADEPTNYSGVFVFVQLLPAVPVLVGGLSSALGRSRRFAVAGVVLGVATTRLIWALEP